MLPALKARTLWIAVAGSVVTLMLIYGLWANSFSAGTTSISHAGTQPSKFQHGDLPAASSMKAMVEFLFHDLKPAPDAPTFDDGEGNQLTLPSRPRYTKPLGKDVLILDLDTRPLESTKAYEEGRYDWHNTTHVPAGIFTHYVYAMIHGYDYKFVQAENFEDRHATWIKPSALANQLKKYKFIVFLDADATFRYLHLPMEWLLNFWDIQPQHSITMALDPWDPKQPQYNSDQFNRTYTNTGFMVVQNNPHTPEILKAWHECPDDTRYANCSAWKEPKFHEQSAFGEFIRYDYEDYLKELPCAEANGFPGVEVSKCQGRFIRHYWFEKSNVKKDFTKNIMQAFTFNIQSIFAQKDSGVLVKTGKNEIH